MEILSFFSFSSFFLLLFSFSIGQQNDYNKRINPGTIGKRRVAQRELEGHTIFANVFCSFTFLFLMIAALIAIASSPFQDRILSNNLYVIKHWVLGEHVVEN